MGALSGKLKSQVLAQRPTLATITVDDEKVKVGTKPLTANDFAVVNEALALGKNGKKVPYVPFQQDPTDFVGQVSMIIRKTRVVDENGELGDTCFDMADKPDLMLLGVDVISTWFADLFGDQVTQDPAEDIKDAEGN